MTHVQVLCVIYFCDLEMFCLLFDCQWRYIHWTRKRENRNRVGEKPMQLVAPANRATVVETCNRAIQLRRFKGKRSFSPDPGNKRINTTKVKYITNKRNSTTCSFMTYLVTYYFSKHILLKYRIRRWVLQHVIRPSVFQMSFICTYFICVNLIILTHIKSNTAASSMIDDLA